MRPPGKALVLSYDDRARAILEGISDAFFHLDRDFRFTYLNGTAARLLRREDLVGKNIWTEFPAARGSRFQLAYERAMIASERVDFVEHYPAPLDRWYEVRAYPMPDGVAVFFQDVTDRRLREAELERTIAQFELVVRGADVGVWYCPLPFSELIWDAKVKEHFHLPPDARVTIDTFYERLHPDDRERTRLAIARSVEEKTHYDIDYRTVSPDGKSMKWIHASGRTYYDAEGKPIRFDGITIDASQRKLAERERERLLEAERAARAEAERQSRARDEFLATMSHELRTPLNAILGWATLLKESPVEAQKLERGRAVIERNARALDRLVGDLLDVSRIVSGKLRLNLRHTGLATVIHGAADVVRNAAESKGIRLSLELGDDLGALAVDPDRLQQILWNLLTNAVRHTPRGGRVTVTAERDDACVRIRVSDTGDGIAAEHLPYIFERFWQVDGSITRSHGGLGLGLAIVRHLVEAHGGLVEARSGGPGRGAEFSLELPTFDLEEPAAEPLESIASEAPASLAPRPAPLGGAMEGTRVLLVEDDADTLELVRSILETAGARVTACSNAPDALAAPGPFDVIVSDIGMPGMDGYAFMEELRARGDETPALAMTAYARPEDVERAHRAGYQGHIAKPAEAAALVGFVCEWLKRR